ncbi:MAG TPA: hypothetical protein VL979_12500 [Solirubrobacteraceae bacterium]|nr:hypothetical protein [Solirubrobacteraceae bacterium]
MDEIDSQRWRAGLAQLDCARELLDAVGIGAARQRLDLELELTPRLARVLLDASRAVYEVECRRLADAAADGVHLPQRSTPALRSFIVDIEQRAGAGAKDLKPLLEASEKRAPRSARGAEAEDRSERQG